MTLLRWGSLTALHFLLDPTVAIGSISSVNAHISEIGLPGINTLPTQILDLYPPPNISGSEEESDDVVESNFIPPAMAHKKRNSARIDKAYKVELQNTKASTSKVHLDLTHGPSAPPTALSL